METKKTLRTLPDSELVELVKSKSTSTDIKEKREADLAFERLFNKYRNNLRYSINSNPSDFEDVEDITMMAFAKAYKNIHSYNEKTAAFSTWLYKIFENLFIDYMRKKRYGTTFISDLTHTTEEGDEIPCDIPSLDRTVEEDIVRKEEIRVVREAIKKIKSPLLKKVIEMRFYKDMCYEAIAEELGKPKVTLRVTFMRAKEEVKKILGDNPLFC